MFVAYKGMPIVYDQQGAANRDKKCFDNQYMKDIRSFPPKLDSDKGKINSAAVTKKKNDKRKWYLTVSIGKNANLAVPPPMIYVNPDQINMNLSSEIVFTDPPVLKGLPQGDGNGNDDNESSEEQEDDDLYNDFGLNMNVSS